MGEEVTRVSTDVYNLEKLLASTLLGSLLLRSVMFVDECTVACPFWAGLRVLTHLLLSILPFVPVLVCGLHCLFWPGR